MLTPVANGEEKNAASHPLGLNSAQCETKRAGSAMTGISRKKCTPRNAAVRFHEAAAWLATN
jgi:hypothetical protein